METYLKTFQALSYERLQGAFADLFGLAVSRGGLMNMLRRSQGAFVAERDKAIKAIMAIMAIMALRRARVIASDETGVRIEGSNSYHWVFRCSAAVIMDGSRDGGGMNGGFEVLESGGERHPDRACAGAVRAHYPYLWVRMLGTPKGVLSPEPRHAWHERLLCHDISPRPVTLHWSLGGDLVVRQDDRGQARGRRRSATLGLGTPWTSVRPRRG